MEKLRASTHAEPEEKSEEEETHDEAGEADKVHTCRMDCEMTKDKQDENIDLGKRWSTKRLPIIVVLLLELVYQ